MGDSSEFFNITLTMPNINKTMNNESVYVAMKLPVDEELYIVDFHPIYNRLEVHFITTYLCSKPFLTKENYWFDHQACRDMDLSTIIYEWYNNVPTVPWPKNAGFQVGLNTAFRYVVIHIKYLLSMINDIYGQQIIMVHTRPKYKIEIYQIGTNLLELQKNRAVFSCQYHSSSIQIFSAHLYSNYEGRTISLYRRRNKQLKVIIKGNLQWPQTFYQIENSIDINNNDYLMGSCVYENNSINQNEYTSRNIICQIQIIFWKEQEDEIPNPICWNNNFPRIVERFLPNDINIPPQTLFDINPIYPKLSPNEWMLLNINISLLSNNTNILSLTYLQGTYYEKFIHFVYNHELLMLVFILCLFLLIGLIMLMVIINKPKDNKTYLYKNNNRSKAIIIGGETSSLSRWLTRRRFQQHDQDDNDEKELLTDKHRWASASDESGLSDNEIFNTTDFQHVILRN